MPGVKAVLFDYGGTLFDYATLREAEKENLADLVRWSGIEVDHDKIWEAYRNATRRVFVEYLSKAFYFHSDLFRDIVVGMLKALGVTAKEEHLERYRKRQWERHARDFKLRDGVIETLSELRNRGLYLGIVSNIDEDQLNYLVELGQIRPYFDSLISSEKAKSCKPDPVIFEKALSLAGCRPDEVLFVGDTPPADIAGANQAGMRSVLIRTPNGRKPPETDPIPMHIIRRIPDLLALV
jgi:putative hydrolase of the HAD superfamily